MAEFGLLRGGGGRRSAVPEQEREAIQSLSFSLGSHVDVICGPVKRRPCLEQAAGQRLAQGHTGSVAA